MSASSADLPLTWIPRSSKDKLRPPRHLKDFERSWFDELLWAMFDNKEMQGYLSMTSNLAWLAGAHRIDFWDANKSVVMACFERAQVAGQEVIYYPPLVELIESQKKKLRGRRARGSPASNDAEAALNLSLDFDSKKHSVSSNARDVCPKHGPQTSWTQWGECWSCYGEKYKNQGGCAPA